MKEKLTDSLPYESLVVDDEVSLRQLQLSEAEEVFSTVDKNRSYLGKWLPFVKHTVSPADSEQFIADTLRKRREGSEYGYAIIVDGKPVGHTSLMHITDDKEPEIGYWVSKAVSGRGIATKAAGALTEFGLEVLGLEKIVIKARPDNIGSNKIAEKLGFTLVSTDYDESEGHLANTWSKSKSDIE